jgi:hypothetical protein
MLQIQSEDLRINVIENWGESKSENSTREWARKGGYAGNTELIGGEGSADPETERKKVNPEAVPWLVSLLWK